MNYKDNAKILKALGDISRLRIINYLSYGEMCAGALLSHFDFTQPTLSHHMKVLVESGLVKSRKEGTWNYYSLDTTTANKTIVFLMNIITNSESCTCKAEIETEKEYLDK